MIYAKKHFTGHKVVVGICDSDLIGKKFEEGEKCISVSEIFFKGEIVGKENLLEFVKGAASLNIVGKEAVETCIDLKLVGRESVLSVDSVPYAVVFELEED